MSTIKVFGRGIMGGLQTLFEVEAERVWTGETSLEFTKKVGNDEKVCARIDADIVCGWVIVDSNEKENTKEDRKNESY